MSDYAPRLSLTNQTFTPGIELRDSIDRFAAAAVRASALDPFTTELVRLRCAQYHDCRLCGSLRVQSAIDEGLDERAVAKIANYEASDLNERAKVALRFVDAMITQPAMLDTALRTALRAHFSDQQIAELACDVMKWSKQKVLVALRLEEPSWDGTAILSFDASGEPLLPNAA